MMRNRTQGHSMKAAFGKALFFFAVIALFALSLSTVKASAKTVKITGQYYQTDARKMLSKINKFRTGAQAWYYTPEGSKTYAKGLKKLKYDYALEKVAMKRAAEIARSFSHTRPNGTLCFSAYPSGYMAKGENIAMGGSVIMGMSNTFELWQETDQPYSGQGHRRNMLYDHFTCVGVACFEVNGCKYWVQEFGSPTLNKKKTKACNAKKTVKIKVK